MAELRIMSVATAEMIWMIAGVYGAIGVVFALTMILGLIKRLDPIAFAAPWRVKLLLCPGLVALWPLAAVLVLARRSRVGP